MWVECFTSFALDYAGDVHLDAVSLKTIKR